MTQDSGKLFAHSSPSVTCQLIGNSTIVRVFLRYNILWQRPPHRTLLPVPFPPHLDRWFIPLHIWDWHNSEQRTNSNIESFHATMTRFFAHPHLTIYKFVELLFQLSNGQPAPRETSSLEWQTWFPTPSMCNFCNIDKIMFYVTKSSFIVDKIMSHK